LLLFAKNNSVNIKIDGNVTNFRYEFAKLKADKITSIILIGRTGCGKSTVGNRLTLDITKDGNTGQFAARSGGKSCTDKVDCCYMIENYSFMTSIIDTPGLDDTEGRDQIFLQSIIDYFSRFTIGKKIICFTLNLKAHRIDERIQAHLILAYA